MVVSKGLLLLGVMLLLPVLVLADPVPYPTTFIYGNISSHYTKTQNITLVCFNTSGFGCASTQYRIDGNNWVTHVLSGDTNTYIVMDSDGNHKIEFYSTDGRGTSEPVKAAYSSIDNSPPTIESITGNENWKYADFEIYFNNINFAYSNKAYAKVNMRYVRAIGYDLWLDLNIMPGQDANHGTYYTQIRMADAKAEGNIPIPYSLIDRAGNELSGATFALIDRAAPTIISDYNVVGWSTTIPTIRLTCTDANAPNASGIANIYFTFPFDGNALVDANTYLDPDIFRISAEITRDYIGQLGDGNHLLQYYCTDNADHASPVKSQYIAVDTNISRGILHMADMPFYSKDINSSGTAVAQMILNYIRLGAGYSSLSQKNIYEYGCSYNNSNYSHPDLNFTSRNEPKVLPAPDENTILLDHFDGSSKAVYFGGTYTSGTMGSAGANFSNQTAQYIFTVSSSGTIEMFFRPPINWNSTTNFKYLVGSAADSFIQLGIGDWGTENSGRAYFRINDGSTTCGIMGTTTSWNAGTWYYIAGRWNTSGCSLVVNGIQEAAASKALNVSENKMIYLASYNGTAYLNSVAIDEFRISSIVQTAFPQVDINSLEKQPVASLNFGSNPGQPYSVDGATCSKRADLNVYAPVALQDKNSSVRLQIPDSLGNGYIRDIANTWSVDYTKFKDVNASPDTNYWFDFNSSAFSLTSPNTYSGHYYYGCYTFVDVRCDSNFTDSSAEAMDVALGHYDPYDANVTNEFDMFDSLPDGNPYQGYNYSVHAYDTNYSEAMNDYIRDIAHWMAYPVTQSLWWMPGPLVARPYTPAALPIFGSYNRWVAVNGFAASANPAPIPRTDPWFTPPVTLYGFWLTDPTVGGLGQHVYVTASDANVIYFKPMKTNDDYNGKYVQIAEPPAMPPSNQRRYFPQTRPEMMAKVNIAAPVKDTENLALIASGSFTPSMNSWEEIADPNLLNDEQAVSAFSETEMQGPVRVQGAGGVSDYYLVPFNKLGLTSGVIMLDASQGFFRQATWASSPQEYLPMTKENAFSIILDSMTSQAQKDEFNSSITKIKSALVWAPNKYSQNPWQPYWQIELNAKKWFVTQDGRLYAFLPKETQKPLPKNVLSIE